MYKNISYTELLNELSHNYWDSMGCDFKIYKGIASKEPLSDYYQANPNIGIRQSKTLSENGNVYNLLLNNLPKWSEICKREKSIIGTSNLNTASTYGEVSLRKGLLYGKTYVIIPKPNSAIAVASSDDIWYSFRSALGDFGLRGSNNSLVQFNLCVLEIFKSAGLTNLENMDWDQLTTSLQDISLQRLKVTGKLSFQSQILLNVLTSNSIDIMNYIDNSFDPNRNNVIMINYTNKLKSIDYKNNEVWTESESLLIEIHQYKLLDKSLKLRNRIFSFPLRRRFRR